MYDEGLDPPALPAPVMQPPMMGHNGGPPLAPEMPGVPTPAPVMPPQAVAPPPPVQPAEEPPEAKQERKMGMIADAIMLLRNDKLRGFRIDIETDSTIAGDAQEEKESRIAFVEGVTKFIEQAGQTIQIAPAFAPLAAKMLQFAVRGFRVGRDLETAIEEFCDQAEQKAKEQANGPSQPSPEQIKADSERYKADKEVERQLLENEGEQQNNMIDLESKKLDVRMKEMELEMKRLEFHSRMAEANAPAEGDEGSKPAPINPHLALNQIAEAAKVFDLASKRNAAPRKIVRGPDGKASHVVTDFQEQ
jgi:hypothetical protein